MILGLLRHTTYSITNVELESIPEPINPKIQTCKRRWKRWTQRKKGAVEGTGKWFGRRSVYWMEE